MMAKARVRHMVLGVLLLGSIAASVAVSISDPDADVVEVKSMPRGARQTVETGTKSAAPRSDTAAPDGLVRLMPRVAVSEPTALFRVVAPLQPTTISPTDEVREEPATAPPLPFKYLGRMGEADAQAVLLAVDGSDIVVGAGERPNAAGGSYRVDEITETAIHFTYLPLEERQTLKIGESN